MEWLVRKCINAYLNRMNKGDIVSLDTVFLLCGNNYRDVALNELVTRLYNKEIRALYLHKTKMTLIETSFDCASMADNVVYEKIV